MSIIGNIRCLFADCAYLFAADDTKELVKKDVCVYASKCNYGNQVNMRVLNKVLAGKETFRNIYYYRMKSEIILVRIFNKISKIFLQPVKSVEIRGGFLGGGGIYST